jgi:DNA modification methylase
MNNNSGIRKYLNQVFLKDVMDLLKELPDKSVDLVYGDPDYNVGIRYGDKSYTRTFAEYIEWYIELARECLRVLKDTGNMFLINYPKQNAYLRVRYLDEACYQVSDYVWVYNTNVGHSANRFTTAHRSILHCRKTKNNKFYKANVAVPYQNPMDKRILQNLANGSKGRMPYDWFYFDLVKNISREKTFHACQIPQKLSEMLIKSCTKPEDVVLILFGGSGSEIEVCKVLNRRYVSAEIDEKYHKMITDRVNKGKIEEKYRQNMKKYEIKNIKTQLTFLEEQEEYLGREEKTFKLRYYYQSEVKEWIRKLLTDVEAKGGIAYEISDLSRNRTYDEDKERQVYERDFKPRARILKKRTGQSIRKQLRGGKGKKRYYVSIPGTIAVVRDAEIEWYTIGDEEIGKFLRSVSNSGYAFLEKYCR